MQSKESIGGEVQSIRKSAMQSEESIGGSTINQKKCNR
jgi:hypothetical protein